MTGWPSQDEHEFEMWGEITALENTPALRLDIPEADEVRVKRSLLLKGVLQWQLEREFQGPPVENTPRCAQYGRSAGRTQRSRRQIDDTMRNEPLKFAEFQRSRLRPRVRVSKA